MQAVFCFPIISLPKKKAIRIGRLSLILLPLWTGRTALLFLPVKNRFYRCAERINALSDLRIDFSANAASLRSLKKLFGIFDTALNGNIIKLLELLETFITESAAFSLLHGDLWSGNLMSASGGKAVLVDPS